MKKKITQTILIALILALLLAMTISIVAAQAAGSLVWSG